MLKIGFDAKRLFNNFTGLGNYSRTLVQGLKKSFTDNEYYLFTPKTKQTADTNEFFSSNYEIVQPTSGIKSLWRSYSCVNDIKKLELDLYHGLSHELPVGIKKTNSKSLVTIHDLIYKTYPNDFKFIDRKIYDYKFRYACENADKIIAVSESTKTDLVKIYNIPTNKIEVVYQSCLSHFKNNYSGNDKQAVLKKYNLPEKFLLYVGSIIERKNLLSIVKAIHNNKDLINMPLVVVGNGKEYKAKVQEYIRQNKLENQVIFTKGILFTDLPVLYQCAEVFIYPSYYEGFGIPIIESLWSKTPVITTNISSLPEAAGPGAYYCNPEKSESIAEGIIKITNDELYKQKLIKDGFDHVQKFESDKNAKKLMNVYKSILQ